MKIISMAVAFVSGGVAGTAFAGAALALGVITRSITMFGFESPRGGWALTLGTGFASFFYMAGLSLPLGAWAGIAAVLLGGIFVGMVSSALAEMLELLPMMIVHMRVPKLAIAAVIALMLGKACGAIVAALAGL